MRPETQLIVFTMLLSLTLSYAWWIKFRVWMLRQDLFLIRDRLWDTMRSLGELDDPGHRQVRDHINAAIRLAPLFTVWTVIRIAIEGPQSRPLSEKPIRNEAQEALDKAVLRISRYLLFETLSGLLFFSVASLVVVRVWLPMRVARQRFDALMQRVLNSDQLVDESRVLDELGSGALANF
ncbi:MAG: hypothetical protein ACLQIB_16875 [Isosphaeraceae bacterium]